MAIKVGINGLAVSDAMCIRAAMENKNIEIVAANDLTSAATLAHLLKYDSVLGNLDADVKAGENSITVNGKTIKVFAEKDPALLPWSSLGRRICGGIHGEIHRQGKSQCPYEGRSQESHHFSPGQERGHYYVMGVNEEKYDPKNHHVVSNASCTTNCLGPFAKSPPRQIQRS